MYVFIDKNQSLRMKKTFLYIWILLLLAAAAAPLSAQAAEDKRCVLAEMNGEVKAGEFFVQPIGGGLEFRLRPLPGNTGWDIQVDQQGRRSYPDYVELATPPYRSMNERELATTFGVRAQEAISWSPRSFRFLTSPAQAAAGARHFALVAGLRKADAAAVQHAQQQLGTVLATAASGELKVVDARIVLGVGDPVGGSAEWAERLAHTPYQTESVARPSAVGELRWIRFRARLWLPAGWAVPLAIAKGRTSCQH